MGWSSFIKSEWTTNMLSLVNSQDRYDALIDKTYYHEGKKTEDSFWREFAEQASWYSLSGKDTPMSHFGTFQILDGIVLKMSGQFIH